MKTTETTIRYRKATGTDWVTISRHQFRMKTAEATYKFYKNAGYQVQMWEGNKRVA